MPQEHLEKDLLLSKELGFEIVIQDEILVKQLLNNFID